MNRMVKSDLPFGSEFSPQQVDLRLLLEYAHECGPDWRRFEDKVRETYFDSHGKTDDDNRAKLANNTKLSMRAYGIIGPEDSTLTPFGRSLFELRNEEDRLHLELARHILLELKGLVLLQCVRDMKLAGAQPHLNEIRKWLAERGVHFPSGGKHPSIMKRWLMKAGVVGERWEIHDEVLDRLLGYSQDEVDEIAMLSDAQKAFLKALANMGGCSEHLSNEIARLAEATYGSVFDEKNLPKQVLYPLENLGYIALERGTKKKGRGAKPFFLTTTGKFKADILLPLVKQMEQIAHADLRPFLRKEMGEILDDLSDPDTHVKGLALEALAVRLLRLIDLKYMGTRLRGDETGGAEVDVVFQSDRLVYSRWQIQCKNKPKGGITLEDVAKEVGLTHSLKSNAIVVLTTGQVGSKARQYADTVMRDSNLAIALLSGEDLDAIVENHTEIVRVLNREARHAMTLKKLEI